MKKTVPDSEPSDAMKAKLATAVLALRDAKRRANEAQAECDRLETLAHDAKNAVDALVAEMQEQHGNTASARALAEAKAQP